MTDIGGKVGAYTGGKGAPGRDGAPGPQGNSVTGPQGPDGGPGPAGLDADADTAARLSPGIAGFGALLPGGFATDGNGMPLVQGWNTDLDIQLRSDLDTWGRPQICAVFNDTDERQLTFFDNGADYSRFPTSELDIYGSGYVRCSELKAGGNDRLAMWPLGLLWAPIDGFGDFVLGDGQSLGSDYHAPGTPAAAFTTQPPDPLVMTWSDVSTGVSMYGTNLGANSHTLIPDSLLTYEVPAAERVWADTAGPPPHMFGETCATDAATTLRHRGYNGSGPVWCATAAIAGQTWTELKTLGHAQNVIKLFTRYVKSCLDRGLLPRPPWVIMRHGNAQNSDTQDQYVSTILDMGATYKTWFETACTANALDFAYLGLDTQAKIIMGQITNFHNQFGKPLCVATSASALQVGTGTVSLTGGPTIIPWFACCGPQYTAVYDPDAVHLTSESSRQLATDQEGRFAAQWARSVSQGGSKPLPVYMTGFFRSGKSLIVTSYCPTLPLCIDEDWCTNPANDSQVNPIHGITVYQSTSGSADLTGAAELALQHVTLVNGGKFGQWKIDLAAVPGANRIAVGVAYKGWTQTQGYLTGMRSTLHDSCREVSMFDGKRKRTPNYHAAQLIWE